MIGAPEHRDTRGVLTVCQPGDCIPFEIARVYFIHGVPEGAQRGGHAHRRLEQVMFAIAGRFRVVLDDGCRREAFDLAEPSHGIYTATMVWRELEAFSDDAVCMVLASDRYDASEYIRCYKRFLNEVRQKPAF
jgi:dTDP-4-dehydrorhamnose 3,5-epimerase-like enzyme